jgi:hypothetical protein
VEAMHAVKKQSFIKANEITLDGRRLKQACQQDSTHSTKKAGYKKHTNISIPFQN